MSKAIPAACKSSLLRGEADAIMSLGARGCDNCEDIGLPLGDLTMLNRIPRNKVPRRVMPAINRASSLGRGSAD